ncbi:MULTISPECIES: ABC transporter substrate-binding protein [Chryseobacterium]|uniref:ABC transporter substrate-binding protein n=1 Tax=Chryseobacterium TaxID=59732 RepID=UPI000483D5BE|nr:MULTISPECIES: ABC transporter substrate-binding protein [Chryseobacterium]MEB4761440.1 ABC transporter substrate-binding protein [Chryseobacterium indologenes]UDQ51999.1 ABC transporter substrate-binding protein [Chryseobacterium indologenes]VFA41271.1 corrinoid ABC transporter substrate-binding protein [Chryseobacterium indologenes]
MKQKILLLFTVFSLIACKRESKISSADWTNISSRTQFKEHDGAMDLKSGNFTYSFKQNQIPFKKIILLNASMAGYISELGAENLIVGVSSPEYIYSEKIQNLLKEGKIQNVGSDQKYDVEKIISLKPDAVFTNHIASFDNTYELLKNNGIHVVFLDEYMEQQPLEKTAYIKLFGQLLGKEKEAAGSYREIEKNYTELKKLALSAKEKPVVLANEMYGDIWYLPGGNTSVAHYIADANASYILKDNKDEKALTMTFEEVYAKTGGVQYWVNAGNHTSKSEMLKMNGFYGKLEVFNKGKIYTMGGKERQKANDFFESGAVRADLILKDYIKIFHPELLPNYQLTYMKELQ